MTDPEITAEDIDEVQPLSEASMSRSDCGCDAKFADLTRAVEMLSEQVGRQSGAINTLGEQVQWMVNTVRTVSEQFSKMNPAQMLKGLMSRG